MVDLTQTGGVVGIKVPDNTVSPIELNGTGCKKGKKQSVHLHFRGILLQKSNRRSSGEAASPWTAVSLGQLSAGSYSAPLSGVRPSSGACVRVRVPLRDLEQGRACVRACVRAHNFAARARLGVHVRGCGCVRACVRVRVRACARVRARARARALA